MRTPTQYPTVLSIQILSPKAEPDASNAQDVWADTDTGAMLEMDYGTVVAAMATTNEKVSVCNAK